MGLNLLHAFANTLAEAAGSGAPGGPAGPDEWNAGHQLYLDVNAQTGTTYAIATTDLGALVTFNNSAAVAVSIAAAVAGQATIGSNLGFYRGWFCFLRNLGGGTVTITPAAGTINGKASDTLAPGHFAMLISDGVNYQLLRNSISENASPLPQGYRAGGILSNDATSPNTVIDISPLQRRDSANNFNIVTSAIYYKSISAAFAVGAGTSGAPVGGMGNGLTAAINTWYHVHAIYNPTTGVSDVYFDTSPTAANIPAGFVAYCRLTSIATDSSGHILPFKQNGYEVRFVTPQQNYNASTVLNSATPVALLTAAPPGVKTQALIWLEAGNSAQVAVSVWDPDLGATATGTYVLLTVGANQAGAQLLVRTNVNQQIDAMASSATGNTLYMWTQGWIEPSLQ